MTEDFEAWVQRLLDEWWGARPESTRESLRAAAKEGRMDAETVRLLIESRCPIGPVGSKWEGADEYSWMWAGRVKDYILTT